MQGSLSLRVALALRLTLQRIGFFLQEVSDVARYEHLPIYQQVMDVTVHFEKVVAGLSRYHKISLGTQLRHASRAVISQLA